MISNYFAKRWSLISLIPASTACWRISFREPENWYSLLITLFLMAKPTYTSPTDLFSWAVGPSLLVKLKARSVPNNCWFEPFL
jgi:hypothetical protein